MKDGPLLKRCLLAEEKGEVCGAICPPVTLLSMSPPSIRMEHLQDQVFGKLRLGIRTIPLIGSFGESAGTLAKMMDQRAGLIGFAMNRIRDDKERVQFIFGLRGPRGVNRTFFDVVNAIVKKNDECVHFGRLLCEDLMAH